MCLSRISIIFAATLCLPLIGSETTPELGEKLFEQSGGFSIRPPKGWDAVSSPGIKYRGLIGPAKSGFKPNITFADYAIEKESLEEYADRNTNGLPLAIPNFKLISKTEIKLDSGVRGIKVVISGEHKGITLKQTHYMFDGIESRRWLVTVSVPAEDASLDSVLDASVKTFVHEKRGIDPVPIAIKLKPGERYTEQKGHYSFIPPDNWELRDVPRIEYKGAYGPVIDGYLLRITFDSEKMDTALEDFAKQFWNELSKSKPEGKKLDQSDFKLDSGIPCIRSLADLGKLKLRAYFIKTDERIFVIMAHVPGTSQEIEEMLDKCVKSFRLEKP